MIKPKFKFSRAVSVGIYNNCEYTVRVYVDKIIVISPYVRWTGNTGGYAERKDAIRTPAIIAAVLSDLTDGCEDSAWSKIGRALDDDYLVNR
jgi:hypothetical protein